MTMLPSAGCPGYGQSVLSGADSLQESVLKRKGKKWKSFAVSFGDFWMSCAMSVIRSETVLRDKLTLWNSLIFFSWHEQLLKFTLGMRFQLLSN